MVEITAMALAGDLLDAGRDVPQARGDGARPSVQGLDLRLQV